MTTTAVRPQNGSINGPSPRPNPLQVNHRSALSGRRSITEQRLGKPTARRPKEHVGLSHRVILGNASAGKSVLIRAQTENEIRRGATVWIMSTDGDYRAWAARQPRRQLRLIDLSNSRPAQLPHNILNSLQDALQQTRDRFRNVRIIIDDARPAIIDGRLNSMACNIMKGRLGRRQTGLTLAVRDTDLMRGPTSENAARLLHATGQTILMRIHETDLIGALQNILNLPPDSINDLVGIPQHHALALSGDAPRRNVTPIRTTRPELHF